MKKFIHNDLYIDLEDSIINALKQMDAIDRKLLIVIKDKKYFGLISIGDVQRAIINNISLDTKVNLIMRKDYFVATPKQDIESIKEMMISYRVEFMPVVDSDNNIIDIYFWNDIFVSKKLEPIDIFNIPVIIMAGGFGTRLKPLTNVIPKPLIPISERTIIEEIISKFSIHGCENFYISVNYKADLIEYYLKNLNLKENISFFKEETPMGTGGSLSLLKNKINETFFVTNCDILIEQDYSEILKFHRENNNEITIVAVMKNYPIAYGTLETSENGRLISIIEKPDLTFKINSGMYILEPNLLQEIPDNEFYHITYLIEKLNKENRKIGVYPINEKSWTDIGNWDEYLNFINL